MDLSFYRKIDWVLLIPVFLLVMIGLFTLYAINLNVDQPDLALFNRQFVFAVLGFIIMILLLFSNYRLWHGFSVLVYLVSVFLLIAVLWWGSTIRGTTGWFQFFGFSFQPVELAKIGLILILARLYNFRPVRISALKSFFYSLFLAVIPIGLVIAQPDFGSAFILMAIWIGFFALNHLNKKILFYLVIIGLIILFLLWNYMLVEYQKERIMTFLNPSSDPLGKGYNLKQSIVAVGSGGIWGKGLGFGSQSQLHFLPVTETDFIFATICEYFGFLGSLLVIFLYGTILIRIIKIMGKASDNFSLYLVYGFGLLIFFHMIINIGMNIGLLPVTGLPLPFLSYGGSFLVSCLAGMGLIASVNRLQVE